MEVWFPTLNIYYRGNYCDCIVGTQSIHIHLFIISFKYNLVRVTVISILAEGEIRDLENKALKGLDVESYQYPNKEIKVAK